MSTSTLSPHNLTTDVVKIISMYNLGVKYDLPGSKPGSLSLIFYILPYAKYSFKKVYLSHFSVKIKRIATISYPKIKPAQSSKCSV